MLGSDIQKLAQEFEAFRSGVQKMITESTEEAERHVRQQELPLEIPFHEGEAGAYEIVLSALDDFSAKKSPISLNAVEDLYTGLLLDYKRMQGSVEALQTALTEMRNLFEMPTEEEIEQSDNLNEKVKQYGKNAGRPLP